MKKGDFATLLPPAGRHVTTTRSPVPRRPFAVHGFENIFHTGRGDSRSEGRVFPGCFQQSELQQQGGGGTWPTQPALHRRTGPRGW